MSLMTDVTTAYINAKVTDMLGVTLTVPTLLITGSAKSWVCNVQIENFDSTGTINQWKRNMQGLPGDHGFRIGETLIAGSILYNVPIVSNNNAMLYADIGTPVNLKRTSANTWIVNGLAEPMVGIYTLIPVNLGTGLIGDVATIATTNQLLSLGELALYGGGWGVIPFGSYGIYLNGIFQYLTGNG